MTNIINIPSFASVKDEVTLIVPAGVYELEIKEVRQQAIKGGKYEGKPVINLGLATDGNVYIWKQLPMFEMEAGDTKGLTWLRMSTMSFAKAIGAKGKLNLDKLVGMSVLAEVGVQARADRPDETQNFVKTFIVK